MKKVIYLIALLVSLSATHKINAATPRQFYIIRIYHCSSQAQLDHVDDYLKTSYLPFLHQFGIAKVGVFSPIANDTLTDKRIMVWIPLKSLKQIDQLDEKFENIDPFGNDPLIHLDNKDSSLPFNRIEVILTKAFKFQPQFEKNSNLVKSPNRIYEYRSYESATDEMHLRKVNMFNEGGEVELFKRLNFNAVFYSKAITGSRTPNLIYMTSFNDINDRNEHWKTFASDPAWKKLSSNPIYLKVISKNETVLMYAKPYADF